jgi:hypothetical protein
MPKLHVHYEPHSNNAWNDGDIERRTHEWARALKNAAADITIRVANELPITCFRMLVKEKIIDHDNIVFVFNETKHFVNADGRFTTHVGLPPSTEESFLMRLLL